MLTNEQNLWFMNHPDLKAAQEKVKAAKERIRGIQMLNSAQTILRMMYPALKELDTAYNEQLAVEARLLRSRIDFRMVVRSWWNTKPRCSSSHCLPCCSGSHTKRHISHRCCSCR